MKNIEEEIKKQLSLINFDRRKTLLEQNEFSDLIKKNKDVFGKSLKTTDTKYKIDPITGKKIEDDGKFMGKTSAEITKSQSKKKVNCKLEERNDYSLVEGECPGRDAFIIMDYNINGNGYWFSSWGTDETEILDWLRKLKTKEDYENLLWWIYKKYPDFRGSTVIQWIQTNEFSTASFTSFLGSTKLTLGQEYSEWANDWYLKQYSKILKKFNSDETFAFEVPKDEWEWALPPATREAIHVFLPLVALATSLIPGGQGLGAFLFKSSITVGVELMDAAVYKYADKDDYAAGLAVVFAFVGPLDDALGLLIKKVGPTLIKKIATKSKNLTDEEIELLVKTTSNGTKYAKLTKIGMRMTEIIKVIKKAKNGSQLYRTVSWLYTKGLIPTKILGKAGLVLGGGFYTWESINAKFFKYCNTSPLENLKKTDTWILQKLGDLGPYLQPYSTPCDKIMAENAKVKAIEQIDTLNERIIRVLEEIADGGIEFSVRMGKSKMIEVAFLQYILKDQTFDHIYEYGYSYKSDKNNLMTFYNASDIKKVSVYTVGASLKAQYDNKDKKEQFSFQVDKTLNTVGILVIEMFDGKKQTRKQFFGGVYNHASTPVDKIVKFNYGYFDENTEKALKQFQKEKNLTVDGIFGKQTASVMLNEMNANKYGDVSNYANLQITDSEIKRLRKIAIDTAINEAKKVDSETKELVKKMNNSNFEKEKKKLVEAASETDDWEMLKFDDGLSDEGTKKIESYEPNTP